MHRQKSNYWSKLFSTSAIIALLFGGLIIQSVRAIGTNPLPVCVGANCTVSFESTGDYFAWSPPAGARNISFDLMGGQGGRSGGLGGRLTGNLTSVPATLFIYVGGSGNQGSGASGGFNGGGKAGTGRGDEGSGGGATDIRSSTALSDRLAVAAGGGGAGGFLGGSGGAGGGASGSAGTSGQGQGGSGATQSGGGNGGYPNGGSWGESGLAGLGGAGGSSSVSGGGGGGGGYFGGGGGGADIDSCCSNAGGGGGGSSWANSTETNSTTNTAAYRSGAGLALISYVMPPSIVSFSAATANTNSTSLSYSIVFNQAVTGLAASDFLSTGSTSACSSTTVTGSGASYTVAVNGCSEGIYKLAIAANSVTGVVTGPALMQSATDVIVDQTLPTVNLVAPPSPTAQSVLTFDLIFSETVTGLINSDFTLTGTNCSITSLTGGGKSYSVQVSNCTDAALVELALNANSVSDLAGNGAPIALTKYSAVQIDRVAPIGVWDNGVTSSYISPIFEIVFPETISGLTVADFTNIGTASGCVLSLTENLAGTKYTIATSNCGDGTVQISMISNSYLDALGNQGPVSASSSRSVSKIALPAPVPTQAPVPAQSPALAPTPVPQQTAEPLLTGGPSVSGTAPPSASAIEAEIRIDSPAAPKTFSFSAPRGQLPITPSIENRIAGGSNLEIKSSQDDVPIAVTSSQSVKFLDELGIWVAWFLVAIGSIGVLIGSFRLLQGVRTKKLVRKLA